jgi:hypothetical protein
MAVRQVTVPYQRGYDSGVGADLASGSPMGKAVAGQATPVDQAGGATVDFQVQRIHSTEELEQALSIDVEASYGCGAFGAGVSARFSFAKDSKVQTQSLFMTVTAKIELGFLSIDDPALSDDAASLVDRPDVFEGRYGNMFVRGIGRGGLFVGVLRLDTGSTEESERIAGELQGSYGLFSADAQSKFESVEKRYKSETFVRMYHEGGPPELGIKDVTNPLELLDNANRFLQSFKDTPDQVARPYVVTLAPLTIARGPLPPNAADVQHAQDVIVACARRRSVLLDQVNALEYIADHPQKFDCSNGASLDAVRTAAQDTQSDLDLIAQCASAAMDHPSSAKMPSDYATAAGTAYPKAVMPNPLPMPIAAPTATVPDFATCTSWAACQELAAKAGLTAVQQEAIGVDPRAFGVLSFTPPKDTPVEPGSAVTIVTPPPVPEALIQPALEGDLVHRVGLGNLFPPN